MRCYNDEQDPPILGLEVIDGEHVFLFGPHAPVARWVYVRNRDFGRAMDTYFESVWNALKSDKELKPVDGKVRENCNDWADSLLRDP